MSWYIMLHLFSHVVITQSDTPLRATLLDITKRRDLILALISHSARHATRTATLKLMDHDTYQGRNLSDKTKATNQNLWAPVAEEVKGEGKVDAVACRNWSRSTQVGSGKNLPGELSGKRTTQKTDFGDTHHPMPCNVKMSVWVVSNPCWIFLARFCNFHGILSHSVAFCRYRRIPVSSSSHISRFWELLLRRKIAAYK